ncbi:MAG: leucine-rich repeat protein [Muribaculaceae bacterium]|nr:leucine-rich repeat protein [Muribaculaceae bacterium]
MKKKLLFLVVVMTTVAGASAFIPRSVQGIPYTPKGEASKIARSSEDNPFDPGHDLSFPEGEFTFDMIESWSGEGSNRAALVIQWNDPEENNAIVFGYRWDGLATGADMIRAVVADNPQLYGLIQYTNVSSPTDPLGGYTINGFGWDRDGDGDIALKDTKDNQIYYSENGLFIHPRGYDPDKGGSSDYDYDDWVAVDEDDFWGAGWYSSYWSYWVKSSQESSFGYSGWGASGRVLEDGCWDGWNFSLDMMPSNWKNFKAAPNPLPEGAATEFKVDNLYYNVVNYNSRKVALVAPFEMEGENLTAYAGDITVPAEITVGDDTYTVTEIKANAFENANVGTVTLASSVTKIGDFAFLNSTLTHLELEEGAVPASIGKGAFSGCTGFSQFILPEGAKVVPDELFKGTAVAEIQLDGIESIGSSSFEDCKTLTTLAIPETVKSIGAKAFSGCTGLTDVTVVTTFPPSCTDDAFAGGAAAGATLHVPMGYIAAYTSASGWNAFTAHEEFSLAVSVGDRFALDGVAYIVTGAEESDMTVKVTYHRTANDKTETSAIADANKEGYTGSVAIPAKIMYQGKEFSVNEIEEKAFYGASELTSISLPDGIKMVPQYAFQDCTSLETVKIPVTVTELGANAFAYCESLKEMVLPEGLVTIGNRCFQNSGLTSINIPNSLTSLPDYCFYGCALSSITLGDQVNSIGSNCFQSCKNLASVVLPSTIESLPSYLFSYCSSLQSIKLPETITSIGYSAFANCSSLENLSLPASLKALSNGMLQNCTALKEVVIPAGITALQNQVFSGCKSLEKVTMSPEISAINQSAFANCSSLHTIAYHGDIDSTVPGVIRLSDKTKNIGQYAFQNCTAITEIILPDGFTTISGREPFKNTGITELIIPASVTSMNQNYICGDNTSVKFYMCGTTPVAVNKFTFAKTYNNYSFPVIVPTGYADTYLAAANWNSYTVSEPGVEGLSLTDIKLSDDTLSGHLGVNYDIELPERFARVNNSLVLEGCTVTVTLTAEGTDPVAVEVAPDADGTFSAAVEGFKGHAGVTAVAQAVNGDNSYTSAAADVDVSLSVPFAFVQPEYNAHFDEQFSPELSFENDAYTIDRLNFSSSNSEVAYVNKRTGAVSVKRVEGDAVIRAFVVENPEIFAEMTVHAALVNPVESFVLGDGAKNITISYMDIYALCPTVTPGNADIQSFNIEISDPTIATTYGVTAFNPTRKYFELVTHKPGEVDVTFKAQDGSNVSTTYHFIIKDSDRSEAKDSWQDGTFWLNEDWFGHTNGSINYIDKDGSVRYRAYESQNPYESFGCTSQYAMIFGGKLYVMSKQETDGGDTRRGGGRLVVADAKSLKKLIGFDDILDGGDGRACVGINSEKVYIGTTAGIAVFNPETLSIIGKVEGIESGSKYANQLGDMVCADKYVFAIKQAYGTYVIDTETDEVVTTLGRNEDGSVFANPQGVTMTADGMVWVAATSTANGKATTLYCYDPKTLELVKSVDMPSHLSINCGWGAWRSTNFFAEKNDVAIWFGSGVEASIVSGNSGYYRWDTKSDVNTLEPVFVFPNNLNGIDEKTKQAPYATVRYDDRSNQLLIAATHGASSNYRYTWLHFIDCASGEIAKTIRLKDYYWFPALPVFPDKYAPEFENPGNIELDLINDKDGKAIDINVSDKDNIDNAIRLSIVEAAPIEAMEDTPFNSKEVNPVVMTSLHDSRLTLVPLKKGNGEVCLKAESNGVATYLSIPVKVIDSSTGVNAISGEDAIMSVTGRRFHAVGFNGHTMRIYTTNGTLAAEFDVMDDDFSIDLPLAAGYYIIADVNSERTLKCIIK